MKKSVMVFIITLFLIFLMIIPVTSNVKDSKLSNIVKNIKSVSIKKTKDEKLSKGFKYYYNNKEYEVYYYGISKVDFNINHKDFNIKNLFKENILNRDILIEYLENEVEEKNMDVEYIIDDNTSIYYNNSYKVIMCNSLTSKDIYIGIKDMKYNESYCKGE